MGHAMRKRVFGQLWTAKIQISLRIRADWSGPSLSSNRIIGYYRMYEWRAKPGLYFALKDDLNLRIWRVFKGTFSLGGTLSLPPSLSLSLSRIFSHLLPLYLMLNARKTSAIRIPIAERVAMVMYSHNGIETSSLVTYVESSGTCPSENNNDNNKNKIKQTTKKN